MNFLEKIRNSEEQTKKKWLIGLTVISMIAIIAAWIVYMNTFVFAEAGQNESKKIEISFWSTFKSGISGIGEKMKNLGGENKMTIENK